LGRGAVREARVVERRRAGELARAPHEEAARAVVEETPVVEAEELAQDGVHLVPGAADRVVARSLRLQVAGREVEVARLRHGLEERDRRARDEERALADRRAGVERRRSRLLGEARDVRQEVLVDDRGAVDDARSRHGASVARSYYLDRLTSSRHLARSSASRGGLDAPSVSASASARSRHSSAPRASCAARSSSARATSAVKTARHASPKGANRARVTDGSKERRGAARTRKSARVARSSGAVASEEPTSATAASAAA